MSKISDPDDRPSLKLKLKQLMKNPLEKFRQKSIEIPKCLQEMQNNKNREHKMVSSLDEKLQQSNYRPEDFDNYQMQLATRKG